MTTFLCPDTAQLISVGWGRKETQFHGSEGKSAASRKEEVSDQLISAYAFLVARHCALYCFLLFILRCFAQLAK